MKLNLNKSIADRFSDTISPAQRETIIIGMNKAIEELDPRDIYPGTIQPEDLSPLIGNKSGATLETLAYQFTKKQIIALKTFTESLSVKYVGTVPLK